MVVGKEQSLSLFGGDDSSENTSNVLFRGSMSRRELIGLHLRRAGSAIRMNPSIALIPIFLCLALLGSGIAIIATAANSQNKTAAAEARLMAVETGEAIANQLDLAIAPLFSLAQFVKQLDGLNRLADEIGDPYISGSGAPFLPPSQEGALVPTHRNVSGICDDTATLDRFNDIAASIKKSAKMEKVLVNLQIAPNAVVCMAYPLNNTEDFDDGNYLDSTGAIGHDLLNDPSRSFIAKATVPASSVVIAGPLMLKQCADCPPTVKQAFIARLPIESEEHTIIVDGVSYKRWGFAVALINWAEILNRVNIEKQLNSRQFTFRLTRTDMIEDATTKGAFTEKLVILAESPGFDPQDYHIVSTKLKTTNNEWVMSIEYQEAAVQPWRPYAVLITVVFALCFALMAYAVLLQKQIHSNMDAEKTNLIAEQAKQAAHNQHALNEFLAHEVRNPLSAALSACTFITYALEEDPEEAGSETAKTSLSTTGKADGLNEDGPRDRKATNVARDEREKLRGTLTEDVKIIETSLRFINELLRSILDTNKASDKSIVLEETQIDLCQDIFEPVSAMIYKKDCDFEFLIDCPQNFLFEADRLRLQQIVLNLCRNSAKFVSHGFVRLRATEVKNMADRNLFIYVEDSGPGIPVDKQQDLFRKFQDSLDTLAQGTGIGLNLCKQLVDLMGGKIYCDGSYHSGIEGYPGARIVIELPLSSVHHSYRLGPTDDETETSRVGSTVEFPSDLTTCQQSTSAPDISPLDTLPENLSVLFVDDDNVLRKLAIRAMTKAIKGCQIREAASGEAALQLIETQEFDMIFMDQYMTCVDQALKGTETVRAMRARGCKSLICGLSANDMEESFLAVGANTFKLKPFPCKTDEVIHQLASLWAMKDEKKCIEEV